MKKFISGVIVGAVLMMTTQVFGEGLNFIGKKVANETVVKVNGEEAGKAIIVENKSFIPVRDISEKIGATISFEKGGVIALNTNSSESAITSTNSASLEEAIQKQQAEIADTKSKIKTTSEKVNNYTKLISSAINQEDRQMYQLGYDAFKKSLDQLEAALKDQESKLAELQSRPDKPAGN
ncbi:hypothetical protein P9847_18720 [Paenibacillus chibensis]|uniref:Copper amine oxidase-like N-terminal domain-containing protein n=1 Tax=Paenibacillus chibensis TaxID=59846 RepID=A0ABU6PYE8_9BACL|nr:hypothetical protein [Paenibacillus chibensis]